MKSIITILTFFSIVVSGICQTRNVVVGTNGAVVQPTNFWSVDASNARTELGLGSSATNPSSAFQPSSAVLSNLASSNGESLINLSVQISNVSGLQSALDGKLTTNPTLFIGNISNLQSALDGKLSTNPTLQISNIATLQNVLDSKLTGSFPFAISNTYGLQSALDGKLSTNPTLSISNINNLQSSLDSKLTTNPTLFIGNISNLQSALDGKLSTNPTLQIANIASLQTTLNSKLTASFPIAISNVSGLQAVLDGKAATNEIFSISNVNGLQTNLDSKLSIYGDAANLTNFPSTLLRTTGSAYNLTNFPTLNQNTTGTASNVTGVVSITNGGSGSDNAQGARNNFGLVWSGLTNSNASTMRVALGASIVGSNIFSITDPYAIRFLRINADNTVSSLSDSSFRSAIGLGSSATNSSSAFQPSSAVLSNLANSNAVNLTNITISNLGTIPISGGGTGATNAAIARTNLSLGLPALTNASTINFRSDIGLGLSALTNTNITNFRSDIGLGHITAGYDASAISSGEIKTGYQDAGVGVTGGYINTRGIDEYGGNIDTHGSALSAGGNVYTYGGTNADQNGGSIITAIGGGSIDTRGTGSIEFGIDGTRTTIIGTATNNKSISLPNSDGILVAVDTNGSVVSPTNFWQVAPIQTLVQTFAPTVNSNSYGTNARNLYIYSMAPSISGVTNTIILPTNSVTLDGDSATVTHKGTTSSITAVRQAGSTNDLTTISNVDESVKFIRESGQWTFYHNISYVEPIRFTDGNIESNRAASRTNLGLGFAALTNTNTTNFQAAIFQTNTTPTNAANLGNAVAWMEVNIHTNGTTNSYRIPLFK